MSNANPKPPRALPTLSNAPQARPTRALPPIKSPNNATGDTVDESESLPRRPQRRKRQKAETQDTTRSSIDASTSQTHSNVIAQPDRPKDNVPVTESQSREKRRRRPKAHAQKQESANLHRTLVSELENEEDLVNVERADGHVSLSTLPGIATGIGGSAANDRVYIQTTNGFVARNREWIDKRSEAAEHDARLTYGEDRLKPFDIAQQNERIFMYITLTLHGALAGLAIWHVIFCYSLYQPNRTQNFLIQYQTLALPAQTIYYIILSALFVSSMDRYDFANKDKHFFNSLIKFDLAAVSVFVYFTTFCFSVGLSGLDAWISSGVGITSDSVSTSTTTLATSTLPAELTGSLVDPASSVNTWLIINVFRAVFAAFGWLIVAFDPLRNDMVWE